MIEKTCLCQRPKYQLWTFAGKLLMRIQRRFDSAQIFFPVSSLQKACIVLQWSVIEMTRDSSVLYMLILIGLITAKNIFLEIIDEKRSPKRSSFQDYDIISITQRTVGNIPLGSVYCFKQNRPDATYRFLHYKRAIFQRKLKSEGI